MRSLISIILSLLMSGSIYGQDFHLSQYFASPLSLNPAMTGVFNGDIRLAANYRNQWGGFHSFQSFVASVDGALYHNKKTGNFWGAGVMFASDIFQDSEYTASQVGLGGSYNIMLSKRPMQYLSYGVQLSMMQRQFDGALDFGTFWEEGVNYDPGVGNSTEVTFFDVSTGLLWYMVLNESTDVYAGLGVFHVTNPNQSVLSEGDDPLLRKIAAHAGAEFALSGKVSMLPTALFLLQGPSKEINGGTYLKRKLDKRNKVAIYLGAWYRLVDNEVNGIGSDAVILGTRFDVRGLNIGFSYDINVSQLRSVSNLQGGPEVSLIYVKSFERRKKGVRYCPDF